MNQLVYDFLQKTNNNPHKAWDEYIKYHLLSGKPFPEDVKGTQDFIKASKPEQQPKKAKKPYNKKPIQPTEYKMTIEDVVKECERIVRDFTQYQHEAKDKLMAMNYWNTIQSAKIMLSKITGVEYVCTDFTKL
ncbi:MAG TPA: hypothetical protein VFD03_06775 [Clostridia bacterium]|nr:hypothetical protein [Clostridia bacterium]